MAGRKRQDSEGAALENNGAGRTATTRNTRTSPKTTVKTTRAAGTAKTKTKATARTEQAGSGAPEAGGPAIAVIGMACKFPGADDLTAFWERLSAGHDSIVEVPPSRFDIDEVYDPRPGTPGKLISRYGGFLDGIDAFDADFFGIAPREAQHMDPQQRLLLETAAAATEDAGLTRAQLAAGITGVFIGSMGRNYWDTMSRAGVLNLYANPGTAPSVLSGRLSYAFDLKGPSFTVDTACSSSLTAVHLACQSLRNGESSTALVGGANLVLVPEESITFSDGKMLSPDGRCKFASASADGFVRSEGIGVVMLKLLDDAIADGDAIRAVIHGSATLNDGRNGGAMIAPARSGQEQTLRAAYADAGVDPAQVDYVEAHGTGTKVGDPVELGALSAVLGEGRPAGRPLLVGSVKTNIGHCEGAAGIAGLIKAVLCLEKGVIPPSLHSAELTPAVDWSNVPLEVPQELRPWPQDERPGLAGVSSFGISGTNAHVVLGAYRPETVAETEVDERPRLLALSSHTPETLRETAAGYLRYLTAGGAGSDLPLRDIGFSAAARREHRESRLTVVGTSHKEIAGKLGSFLDGASTPLLRSADDVYEAPAQVVFVFPGQGSQWVGMGRELLRTQPEFRRVMEECDAAIRSEVGWSVIERLTEGSALDGVDVVQPTLWAMEVALAAVWRAWGVEPDYVVGHSMGEAAAACVSGALSVADAAAVICRRSALAKEVSGRGVMASVELSAEEARRELEPYADTVSVAAINGPRSTILSGDGEAMRGLLASLQQRGVFCRLVRVDFASHGPQVEPLRQPLLDGLRKLSPRAGSVPMYSTVLTEPVDGSGLDADYWARNLREPVYFGPVIERLMEGGRTVFVEISPHPILAPSMSEYIDRADGGSLAVGSTRRGEPEVSALLDSFGALHLSGLPVDLARPFEPEARYVRLPGPAWQRQTYWFPEAPEGGGPVTRRTVSSGAAGDSHPLLGARVQGIDHAWEGPLDLGRNAYLRDHQVQGVVIAPGTASVELVSAAGAAAFGAPPALRDITYHEGIFVNPAEEPPVLRVSLDRASDGTWTFEISTRYADDDEPRRNVTGHVDPAEPAEPRGPGEPREAVQRRGRLAEGQEFYRRFAAKGNQWLGAFQGIERLWSRDGEALARIEVPASIRDGVAHHLFHPALLDACGHTLAAVVEESGAGSEHDAFVLGGIDRVRVHGTPRGTLWSHAVRTEIRSDALVGDVEIRDENGTLLAEFQGLRLRYLVPQEPARDASGWVHEVVWRSAGPAVASCPAGGFWLLFADAGGTAEALTARLGGRCVVVTPGAGYAKRDADRYDIAPGAADDYRALLDDVRRETGDLVCEGIVHLWSCDVADPRSADADPAASLASAERLGCHSVLRLFHALDATAWPDTRVWLVTGGAQRLPGHEGPVSVGQAMLWGFGRSLIQEYGQWRGALVDLPAGGGPRAAEQLAAELLSDGTENQIGYRSGHRYVARLTRRHVPAADHAGTGPAPGPQAAGQGRFEVNTREVGLLDQLGPLPAVHRGPGPGEVEIRVGHTALNYRDVLTALGRYPGAPRGAKLGWECAGVVTALGDGVAGLRVGDEVVAVAEGALASHVVTDAHLVAPVPARLLAEEALTLPAAYLTAYYGLCELAELAPGERVLIHAATGGVGLAALQIARWRGAEVYATAGSPHKRALLKAMGVKHVADSRSGDFAESVLAATHGKGVDVVLNSLAGEAIEQNLSLLAPYGRYVELSKKDLLENSPIGLLPFSKNLSFFSVDVIDLFRNRPEKAGALLERILELVDGRVLEPLPYEVYDVGDVESAFRQMARARHVGKVLVRFDEAQEPSVSVVPADGGQRLSADGTYVVTGGLGGIGLKLAEWLVGGRAGHVMLLGRSPLGDRAAALDRLNRAGAQVTYHAVDVADEAAMRALLREHTGSGRPPVKGVIHAAGVLDLVSAAELDIEQFEAMVRPKALGAWTLHRLLEREQLDFFVLFSSASAVLGSPRLSAYAAANASLDALAHLRRSHGLPALSVNWGFWASVGMVARYAEQHSRELAPQGVQSFTPEEGIALLQRLLDASATQVTVLAADWDRWRAAYPDAARDPLLSELLGSAPEPAPVSEPEPAAPATPAEGTGDVQKFLVERVAKVLALPTDRLSTRKPLNRLGMDSLMATEVRSEIRREYDVVVPLAKMLSGQSLADLTDFVSSQSGARTEPAPAELSAPSVPEPASVAWETVAAPTRSTERSSDVRNFLVKRVAKVLALPADRLSVRKPLNRLGMDSLMATEVRSEIQREFGVVVPLAKMLSGQSLADLTDFVSDELTTKG
ncbi:SDR family NAD(P)-dependent oxidoreductase [Streptomyces sp. GXMU-J15]|uniref:SDR family NAD(P)-dependent oxidoreductase n=1 Tax=Streptomyces fuscus TaxID=3048495 RepID=A0ABT7ITF2_9ACTN|nr:type I polyketide synthase [Streptomyces fuscus]MDL2075858.1 SDR family NAD(P)-dependent oxidoreductase [Streptomyces fuscus]